MVVYCIYGLCHLCGARGECWGVREMSPWLFIVYMDCVICVAREVSAGVLGKRLEVSETHSQPRVC